MPTPLAAGWRCLACGATVDIAVPLAWRCPNAIDTDRHHELQLVQVPVPLEARDHPNPFLAYRPYLAWDSYARALGMSEGARDALVAQLDQQVASVAGSGFSITPFARADALSDALGFTARGGIWVKDETRNVSGSHKARHLFTILLHLLATEATGDAPWSVAAQRPPLAIASCGNAALAAATLAAAVGWPISVFVPGDANAVVVDMLNDLDAHVVTCPRVTSDPPGDPCVHRFREAVANGAIPFSVQGPENAWCLDGGRTIGWEIADQSIGAPLAAVFVQVGGGAFAAGVAAGMAMGEATAPLFAVQTEASAPLQRAWDLSALLHHRSDAAARWSEFMWPWEHVGTSAADGILDDETYDWLHVLEAMDASEGRPVVVTEAHVVQAQQLASDHTDIVASATGTAGLAGVVAMRQHLGDDDRVGVIFSGVRR